MDGVSKADVASFGNLPDAGGITVLLNIRLHEGIDCFKHRVRQEPPLFHITGIKRASENRITKQNTWSIIKIICIRLEGGCDLLLEQNRRRPRPLHRCNDGGLK
jgi:hypothetical protein